MFRKTRIKIVLAIVGALFLFLAVTLLTVFGLNSYSLRKQNSVMLEHYVELYSLDALPGDEPPGFIPGAGEVPDGGEERAIYRLSSFYSAAIADDGTVLAVDSGKTGLYQDADIIKKAGELLNNNKESGFSRNTLYRVDKRDGYTLVAFMDTTVTDQSRLMLLLNIFLAGLIAIVLFFVIAVIIARAIIRPLEDNDRRQKQFVSDAGHELKTPISVVMANTELLARQVGENQWLSNIQYENERISSLVKELLELARTQNSASVFEEIDLSKLTAQEVLPFESLAFEHGNVIESDISGDVVVRGNRHQLEQLISILTDNAISHSTGGVIRIELGKERRHALLRVSNDGPEIPKETRERLFDRFYRSDNARSEGDNHFGLGLAIAKAITDAHRGRIDAECRNGKVIFSVYLPAEK